MTIDTQLQDQMKEWTCLGCNGSRWVPLSDDPAVIGLAPCGQCNGTGKMISPGPGASKKLPHWSSVNPGRADQYRAEARACREALGFDPDAEDISPSDLVKAIHKLGG